MQPFRKRMCQLICLRKQRSITHHQWLRTNNTVIWNTNVHHFTVAHAPILNVILHTYIRPYTHGMYTTLKWNPRIERMFISTYDKSQNNQLPRDLGKWKVFTQKIQFKKIQTPPNVCLQRLPAVQKPLFILYWKTVCSNRMHSLPQNTYIFIHILVLTMKFNCKTMTHIGKRELRPFMWQFLHTFTQSLPSF